MSQGRTQVLLELWTKQIQNGSPDVPYWPAIILAIPVLILSHQYKILRRIYSSTKWRFLNEVDVSRTCTIFYVTEFHCKPSTSMFDLSYWVIQAESWETSDTKMFLWSRAIQWYNKKRKKSSSSRVMDKKLIKNGTPDVPYWRAIILACPVLILSHQYKILRRMTSTTNGGFEPRLT